MRRLLLWATDVHLDHLRHPSAAFEFGKALGLEHPGAEGLIVTGDIAEAVTVVRISTDLQRGFDRPLYFVLGNHDYYGSAFGAVDAAVHEACASHSGLHWLHERSVTWAERVALVGCNGWYDARFGDRATDLQLTDFERISELSRARARGRSALLSACAARADADAALLDERLGALPGAARDVIVALHVPPFQQAAWHEGKTSDDRWAPFFSSRVTGEVLLRHAARLPATRFRVLCGHTHGAGVFEARDNLVVYTGAARYGAPELAGFVMLGDEGIEVSLEAPSAVASASRTGRSKLSKAAP